MTMQTPRTAAWLLALPVVLTCLVAFGQDEDDPAPGSLLEATTREAQAALLRTPAPLPHRGPQVLADHEVGCADCHVAIAEEWAATRHATAWVDESYRESLEGRRRPETCYSCHIPEPLHLRQLGGKPTPRAADSEPRHHGVSCLSCHLGPEGALLGPRGGGNEAHDSTRHPSFATDTGGNQLCISCHRTTVGPVIGIAVDFELAGLEGRGLSCVGCHMAPVERPMATYEGCPTPVREGRSHLLQSPRDPAFCDLAFGLSASREGSEVVVEIANLAGHRIPGLTTRRFLFEAELLDAAGLVLAGGRHELTTKSPLPVGQTAALRIEAGSGGVRVRVNILQGLPEREQPVAVSSHTLELP